MTATMTETVWYTRYGAVHTGGVHSVDLARGTAKYYHRDACIRCGGAGGWRGWPGFTCYRCGGECFEAVAESPVYTAERLEKLKASAAKRDAARVAKQQAAQVIAQEAARVRLGAFQAANPVLAAGLAKYAQEDRFLGSLANQLEDRGTLTPNQAAAAMAAITKRNAEVLAKAASRHVGTVGERIELTLTVERVIRLESNLPAYYHAAPSSIYLCRTQEGHRVVYKGSGCFGQKGETIRVKATITEHGERDNEQQTVVARPKVLETGAQEDAQ